MTEQAIPQRGGIPGWAITTAVVLFTAGVLFVFYKGFGTDPHRVPFGLEGKPAPTFTLQRLDSGEKVSLADFKGKPVVMNFWASWCGPCRTEHPVIEWAHKQFGDQVVFLGVVFEDSEQNAREFLSRYGASFPQLMDDSNAGVAVEYGVTGVPETYFIDRDHVIRGKYAMPIDPNTISARIRELLASPASAGGSP